MKNILFFLLLLIVGCQSGEKGSAPQTSTRQPNRSPVVYRVFYVNSYHQGYAWSDAIEKSVREQLQTFSRKTGNRIELGLFRLDSKRRSMPAEIEAAARSALAEINEFRPDVLIVSDDNAVKYLVVPHLLGKKLPVVYCGVNWSSDRYHLPDDQVTGMVEVQLVDQIIKALQETVRGRRIAFLKGDDFSARIEADAIQQTFGLNLDVRLVKDFPSWKKEYLLLQKETDLLILGNAVSIAGWDAQKAKKWIFDNTLVPSGSWDAWMADFCLVTFANSGEEQGAWATRTALRILQGTPVANIGSVRNHKARVLLNMPLAKKMGIRFPMNLIENATLIRE